MVVTGDELESIRQLFNRINYNCKTNITVLKKSDISDYELTSLVDTNINILQIQLVDKHIEIETKIAVSNSFGHFVYSGNLGDTILCEQSPNLWFLAWFDEPFYKSSIEGDLNKNHRYELHIRAIEKSSQNIIADEILYTTECCLDNLDIKYNTYTKSLLFAFNDFGGNDYKLIYGFIEFNKTNNVKVHKPVEVTFNDRTEKRQPTFISGNSSFFCIILQAIIGDCLVVIRENNKLEYLKLTTLINLLNTK